MSGEILVRYYDRRRNKTGETMIRNEENYDRKRGKL
jgi:hypothetical protein